MKAKWTVIIKSAAAIFISFGVWRGNAQPKRVQANGIMIAYESFGNAADPKIILVNGTGAPMTDWPSKFCDHLAEKGYQVIRFDNRDVGLSTKLDSLGAPDWAAIAPFLKTCKPAPLPYTLLDMANDVKGLMDVLKIEKAHLVGASMGGAIAQLLAIHYPARTLTLSTIGASSGDPNLPPADTIAMKAMISPPPATKNKDSLSAYLVNIYKALGSTDDETALRQRALERVNYSWNPAGTARQVAAISIADNCDRRNELAHIAVPTIIIHGDKDLLVNVDAAKEIAATIPHAELQLIKGMGHDLSMRFADTIVALIAKNAGKVK